MDTNQIIALINPIEKAYKSLSAEWKNFFDIGLTEYLHSQTEKYYFTNTFIHRSEKVLFDKIYYPIKAVYKQLVTDFNNLEEIFSEYNNITLVGSAGSGKTTLLKYIFLSTIRNPTRIPILIELRNLNAFDGDFEKLITEKILKSQVKPNDTTFKRTLESGKFLFLLDGYDEIFSSRKQEINRQIETFVDAYSKNRFLITTRPGSGIESFSRFFDFRVRELSNEDVKGFISKIVDDQERRDRIIKIINDPTNNNYTEYLRNPLLLSMFIMAFENHPEIPSRKNAFYRNVFDTLYSRHDGITKNSFPREKITKLQRDEFEEILCILSYLTLLEGRYSFTEEYLADNLLKVRKHSNLNYDIEKLIYDLRTSISILILDGFEYYFPHRSMQEYFTALFVSKLPTEKKYKAYNNLSTALEKSSTDYSFNFWNLCYELDESVFISVFLIPHLQSIYKKLDHQDDRILFQGFISIMNPVLVMNKRTSTDENHEYHIYRHSSFQVAILDFCQIFDYNLFWEFPIIQNCGNDIYYAIKEQNLHSDDDVLLGGNRDIHIILIKHGIIMLVKDFVTKLDTRIKDWQLWIEKKTNNIDDILAG